MGNFMVITDEREARKLPGTVESKTFGGKFYLENERFSATKLDEKLTEYLAVVNGAVPRIVILDVEALSKDNYFEDIRALTSAFRFRPGWEGCRIGFYDIMPDTAGMHWHLISTTSEHPRQESIDAVAQWEQTNIEYVGQGVSRNVDFISPNLYFPKLRDSNPRGMWFGQWLRYANATLDAAFQYDKPVYPSVCDRAAWRRDQPDNEKEWATNEQWRTTIELVRDRCDGLVWFDPAIRTPFFVAPEVEK